MALSKKVCLLGDFAVGKTSLVRRFVYNLFDDKYISTIGVKVSRKVIVVPVAQTLVEVTMMLWDLAGSEEFDSVRASYLRGAAGAILVCDVTRAETLASLPRYADELRRVSPRAAIVVAGNKCDLRDWTHVTEAQVADAAAALQAPYHLTSAKAGTDVETVFRTLSQLMVA